MPRVAYINQLSAGNGSYAEVNYKSLQTDYKQGGQRVVLIGVRFHHYDHCVLLVLTVRSSAVRVGVGSQVAVPSSGCVVIW